MASSLPSFSEPQDDEVHGRNSPAFRDRRQPLEREVRIVLTPEECLESGGRSELEGVAPGRKCRAGLRHSKAECRERESRRLRPEEDADRAPPAFGLTPESRGNQHFPCQH